jgi:putative MATE family efflux protein
MNESLEIQQQTSGNGGVWSILKEAVTGSNRDFTEGNLGTAIFLLAVPMILEMILESVFALVDIFFVAKLGEEAVNVVGFTESMLALIYAAAIGLSIGATATVARRTGEKDAEGAARAAIHIIYLGIIISAIISVVGIIFAADFLRLLGAEPAVVEQGTTFTQIMLGSNAVIVFLFLLNAIFRGAGDAAIAMRVLTLANILNIFLAPCFIFGDKIFAQLGINAPQVLLDWWIFPELGVTGAAVGTTIGRGVGVLYAAWTLFRPGGRITILPKHFQIDFSLLWQLVRLSSTAVIQYTIGTASWSILIMVVSGFGKAAVGGYIIGLRIIVFALLPSLGLANAAATLVGQSLGAGKPERAEKAVWLAGIYSACFLTLIGICFFAFAAPIISLFTDKPEMAQYATDCLRIVSLGFFFYGFGMVLEQSFNGAGDTLTPTFINLFIFWLFEIPLAYALAYHFNLGAHGVFWAITAAFSMLAITAGILFRRGKWKTKVV